MVKLPAITDYFLAGVAGGEFIKDMLESFVNLATKAPN